MTVRWSQAGGEHRCTSGSPHRRVRPPTRTTSARADLPDHAVQHLDAAHKIACAAAARGARESHDGWGLTTTGRPSARSRRHLHGGLLATPPRRPDHPRHAAVPSERADDPGGPGEYRLIDPAAALQALLRGNAVPVDIISDWDYWPLMSRPLDEVRRELMIEPPKRARAS